MKDDKFDDAVSHARAKLALFCGAMQGVASRTGGHLIKPDEVVMTVGTPHGENFTLTYRDLTLAAGSDLYYLPPEEPKT